MAKTSTIFVCSNCGYESGKWLGKCPACNEWNSFYEEKISNTVSSNNPNNRPKNAVPRKLKEVEGISEVRTSTGIGELDRVLGGGLVKGSLVLVGGEPGIGKSTLILQLCDKIKGEGKVLYVSGEESAEQIKLRADRLDVKSEELMFLGETDIDIVKEARDKINAPICVYNVSGEYAMVKNAGEAGLINEKLVALEMLLSMKRAGAKMIITYYALEAAKWLKEDE